ncbi:hypothetical protein D1872_289750 [compost metagenome]
MIIREKVPPTSRPASSPAFANNQAIPSANPLPTTTPSGPTAINVIGAMISRVTVGTTISFKEACVYLSTNFST